ncbi:uncharacterized protein L969DRAFT_86570 [Mixia osmundae IAM 14324]|nr:uncharacterized protein L969DRAFT_86570 [Mixia osmundae IAM 14324]KEI39963.1 hypothetical protein L969DRAFT_86570 [Mixia osmundae IAM 14324]
MSVSASMGPLPSASVSSARSPTMSSSAASLQGGPTHGLSQPINERQGSRDSLSASQYMSASSTRPLSPRSLYASSSGTWSAPQASSGSPVRSESLSMSYSGSHTHAHSHSGASPLIALDNGETASNGAKSARPDPPTTSTTTSNNRRGGVQSYIAPGSARLNRPTSEFMPMNSIGLSQGPTAENEAIEKFFQDLQHHERVLEEMAAASLDQNFKEELGAIEQWFRVLSEAEKTAALYSLLQSSTQVQIRFFITVLQQMARSDPMAALLSPANPMQASMDTQLEAKLAAMGMKAPGSPGSRAQSNLRQGSFSTAADSHGFLSPHAAMFSGQNSTSGHDRNASGEAANTLAQQRARLKANASHRISAPTALLSASQAPQEPPKSPVWVQQSLSNGPRRSPSPNYLQASEAPRSPRSTHDSFADQLSPLVGGNWASMVNTPLAPMFNGSRSTGNIDASIRDASNKLNAWSGHQSVSGSTSANGIVLDDARKFRRNARGGSQQDDQREERASLSRSAAPILSGGSAAASPTTYGGLDRQQVAALTAQQNWRNGMGKGPNASMLDASMSLGQSVTPQMAHLLNQQQLLQQQIQLQQSMGLTNMMSMMGNGLLSPAAIGGNPLYNSMGATPSPSSNASFLQQSQRRSPRPDKSPKLGTLPPAGSGANPDEDIDMLLLSDVSAWLRSLRLHKYTETFQFSNWRDMVMMDDKALQDIGVSALGARRKLLKIFQTVRAKTGMSLPSDGQLLAVSEASTSRSASPNPVQ